MSNPQHFLVDDDISKIKIERSLHSEALHAMHVIALKISKCDETTCISGAGMEKSATRP